MEFYLQALQLSLCLGTMCMGIYISMKIFNIPDITTDGSYTLGASVTAVLLSHNYPIFIVLGVSMIMGALSGMLTALIHTKLKIDALLAGILVMTGLYSINLEILGRSNIPLINTPSIFNKLTFFENDLYNNLGVALLFIILLTAILTYILKTDFGIAMRATGSNESMTKALGINNNKMKIIGLAIANALTALSGFLVAQNQGFTDINMGIGIVIVGLGSVLIAGALQSWLHVQSIFSQLVLVVFGSLIFQMVLAITLASGVDPNLLKLVTATFVLLIVALPRIREGFIKS
jgi:putative tryptophan/tyrosine transport system permease protein